MELDDFKNIGKSQKAPEFTGDKSNTEPMETFINELKLQDEKQRKAILLLLGIFTMFVVVYSGTFSLQKGDMKAGYALLVFGFVLVLGYMFRKFHLISKVDYTAPATVFLQKAEKRYRFMTLADWVVTLPLLALFIIGGSLIVHGSLTKYFGDSIIPVAVYLLIMACAVGVGFWAGRKNWKKQHEATLEKIREMKREFGV
jgi:hypothetical protein